MYELDLFKKISQEAADERGYELRKKGKYFLFYKTKYGDISFYEQTPFYTSAIVSYIARNKWVSKQIFKNAGINVPEGMLFHKTHLKKAKAWLEELCCS